MVQQFARIRIPRHWQYFRVW